MKRFYFRKQLIFCCAIFFLITFLLFSAVSYAQSQDEEWDRASTLFNDGQKQINQSDFHGAIEKWEAALPIFQKLREKQAIGATLGNLGSAYNSLGEYQKAISYLEKALAIAEEIGNKQGKEINLSNLGNAYNYLGDYHRAISYYEQALVIAEEIGNKKGKGIDLGNLGSVYNYLGDYWKAISCYEQALAIAQEIGEKQATGAPLGNMGIAYGHIGDYRKEISYCEQALAIAEEFGDKMNKETWLNCLGNSCNSLGEYQKAISYLEKALAIAEEIGNKQGKGNALGGLGDAYRYLGDYRKAISYYEQALAIAEEIGDRMNKETWLDNLGLVYNYLGDKRKAISYYEQALAIAKEIGDKQGKGCALGNLGNAYGDLGDYRKAISYYEQALTIAEEIGNKQGKGADFGNLGNAYGSLGDYRKAISYYEQALTIAEEIGDKQGKGADFGNLGTFYRDLGDKRKAISYYEQALAIAEEIGDRMNKETWLNNLGLTYGDLGDYHKAISCHEQALAIAEEIGDKNGRGIILGSLGNAYGNLGDYLKAIDYYEQALAIAEKSGDKQNKGLWLGNKGYVYYSLGDYGKAISYYEQAIAVDKSIGISYDIPEGNLADAYLTLDRDDEAFAIYTKQNHSVRLGRYYLKKKDYQRAKEQFDRGREQDEQQKDAAFIVSRWIGLGLSHEGLKEYADAYSWYTKAIAFMEEQRSALTPAEREHYFEGNEFNIPRIEAYKGAARCAFMLGKLDDVFYWAENTRGRILSELLSSRHSGENYKILPDLAKEEEDLTTQIMINKKQQQTAFQKNNPELLKQAEDKYPALKQKMDAFIDRLRKEYTQYAAIKYPQPVKLSQLALNKGETIIEYEVTNPYTIGLVIRDGKVVKGFKVEKTRIELENLVRKFRSTFQDGHDHNEFRLNPAKELTDLLIKPVQPLLTKGEHLIIIPDETLSLLPFEALLVDVPQDLLKEEAAILAVAKKSSETDTIDRLAIIRELSKKQTTMDSGLTIDPRVSIRIMFDADAAQISKKSEKLMGEILAAFKSKELHNALVGIEGHSDNVGDPGYNLKLSLNRAESVMKYLTKNGVNEDFLTFTGEGDTEPIADNKTETGRRLNRRIDFVRVSGQNDAQLRPSFLSKLVYAIDEYAISYYQSASVLTLQRGLHIMRTKEKTFFGLGDPIFDTKDERLKKLKDKIIVAKQDTSLPDILRSKVTKDAGYYFPRLKNTGTEVTEVGKLFIKPRLLIGPDASEDNVKKEDLTTERYVLFSTHGILGDEIPYIKQPALVLNLVGNSKEDGFLTATKIFNMNLNADLVGLSACQTGLGIQSAGEGVVGLSRAFMYAGTDSVLVSLWSVSDQSTYKLMVKFFKELNKGMDKFTALKEAKNYLRTNGYDNPFYWAPFILVGEAN
jgi:tetratricopeptide (TPR) repeat protein